MTEQLLEASLALMLKQESTFKLKIGSVGHV